MVRFSTRLGRRLFHPLVVGAALTACGAPDLEFRPRQDSPDAPIADDGRGEPSGNEEAANDSSDLRDAEAAEGSLREGDSATVDTTGGDATPQADSGDDREGDVGNACPSDMVEVPRTGALGSYCVDATEVTNGGYDAFLATNPLIGTQPSYCSWNTTYAPSDLTGFTDLDKPVVFVDWCDAFAYCTWAGKHLCGKIDGGANAPSDESTASMSEWFNACSAGGTKSYPYGITYAPAACVGSDFDGTSGVGTTDFVRAAGKTADCVGGYPGLLDMSGNVSEWVNACAHFNNDKDQCGTRGGSFKDGSLLLQCSNYAVMQRGGTAADVGFRCCL